MIENRSGGRFEGYIAAVGLLMLMFTLVCLWQTSNDIWGMYGYLDGQWAVFHLQGRLEWGGGFDLSPFNPLSGTGSMFLPNLPWFNPGAWPFALPWPQELKYILSYAIYFIELMVSTYVLFRAIGLDRTVSFVATQCIFIFFFPPFDRILETIPWYAHAPINAHLAAMCNLAATALLRLGSGTRRRDLGWFALLLASVTVGFFSAPITILTYVPIYGLFCFLLIAGDWPSRRAMATKVAAVLVVLALFWLAGVPDYIIATSAYSARGANLPPLFYPEWDLLTLNYWQRVSQHFSICSGAHPRYLLCMTGGFGQFQAVAVVGAAITAALSSRLRPAAIGYLVFVPLIHVWELAWPERLLGWLSTISAQFFVWAAIPFTVLFVAYPVTAAIGALARRYAWMSYPVVLLVPLLMAFAWFGWIGPAQPPLRAGQAASEFLPSAHIRRPRTDGPVLSALAERTAVTPGEPFRGWTATYFGGAEGWLAVELGRLSPGWPFVHAARDYLDAAFGTTFQTTDLWNLGVPTFDEYGQWISRPIGRLAHRLLEDEMSGNWFSLLLVTRPNLPILEMLGVSHLVTDAELDLPGLSLVAEATSPRAPAPVRLYAIAGSNLADYSPTEIVVVDTFEAALDWLDGNGGRLRSAAVSFRAPEGPLVPARSSRLTFLRDGWLLEAESDARSLLAVPVQFTNCWLIRTRPPSLRIYRGNAVQTFVEFEGKIRIKAKFAFGLIGDTDCRMQDVRELRKLGL